MSTRGYIEKQKETSITWKKSLTNQTILARNPKYESVRKGVWMKLTESIVSYNTCECKREAANCTENITRLAYNNNYSGVSFFLRSTHIFKLQLHHTHTDAEDRVFLRFLPLECHGLLCVRYWYMVCSFFFTNKTKTNSTGRFLFGEGSKFGKK